MGLLAVVAVATPAHANVYVGSDWTNTNLNGQNTNAANVHVGVDVLDHLALEVGTAKAFGSKTDNGTTEKTTDLSVDAIGHYAPFETLPQLEALGTVGVTAVKLTASKGAVNLDDSAIAPTVGAGLQYHLTDKVSVRGIVKYEYANLDTVGSNHDIKTVAGLQYNF